MRGPVVSFRQQCVACSLLCESQEWRALLLKEGVASPLRAVIVASRQALFRRGTGVRVRSRKACQTSRRHRVLFGLQCQGVGSEVKRLQGILSYRVTTLSWLCA